jgi:hypothetical protein
MNLELNDVQAEVLTRELHNIIHNDRYPFSPRIVAPRRSWGSCGPSLNARPCPRDGITNRRAGEAIVGDGNRGAQPTMRCLEVAYYISQIILTVIAGIAAAGAFLQLKASNKSEMLRLLEDPLIRKARGLLWQKLVLAPRPAKWWEFDTELEEAASTVCASFDILAITVGWFNKGYFVKNWAHPICWTHKVLQDYLEDRDPGGYQGYRALSEEADFHWRPDLRSRVMSAIGRSSRVGSTT